MDQNSQNLVWSMTQEPLGLPKFVASFESLGQFSIWCMYHFSKDVDNFEKKHKKHAYLRVGNAVPLNHTRNIPTVHNLTCIFFTCDLPVLHPYTFPTHTGSIGHCCTASPSSNLPHIVLTWYVYVAWTCLNQFVLW